MAKFPIKGKGPSPIASVGEEIGKAIKEMIDDFGSIFTQKPGGKVKKNTNPQDVIKEIQGGAKIVPQGPVTGGRTQGQRIPDAIQAMPGTAGGVARTISRGRTPISELVKAGQRAKPRGMGDRKPVAIRPKPPAKRGNTVPIPKPKPKPPAIPRPKPKPPAIPRPKPKPPVTRGGTGGGGRPPGNRQAPGNRPQGQRPDRIIGVRPSEQAAAAARQALIIAQIQKNLDEASKRGPAPAPAATPKPKKRATPGGMADRKSAPKKVAPTPRAKPKGMADRKSAPISAGKNVGFGPKGNIFPSNAEERKALMLMYGGTGSKAGKAAIAGKQGNIAKGRAAYEAAKRKRLTAKKKAGGKMGSETRAAYKIYKAPKSPMTNTKPASRTYKPKKKPGMTGKPASRIYKAPKGTKPFSKGGKVARQVKGFGAARRPKK